MKIDRKAPSTIFYFSMLNTGEVFVAGDGHVYMRMNCSGYHNAVNLSTGWATKFDTNCVVHPECDAVLRLDGGGT